MALEINGTVRGGDMVVFEARQIDGDRWECVVKLRGTRNETYTRAISPWPTIERMVGEIMDFAPKPETPRFDMNRPLAGLKKIAPKRKRKILPGDLPGDNKHSLDLEAIQHAIERERSNG